MTALITSSSRAARASGASEYWSSSDFSTLSSRDDAWVHALEKSHLPWSLSRRPGDDFQAELVLRGFSGYRMVHCFCGAVEGFRSSSEIAATDGAYLNLLYLRSGAEQLCINGETILLCPGDVVLWDSTRCMEFNVPNHVDKISLLIPEAAITGLVPNAQDLVGTIIRQRHPMNGILTSHLSMLRQGMTELDAGQMTTLMRPTMDLLAAVLGSRDTQGIEAVRRVSLRDIKQHMVSNLTDRYMTPATIAAHYQISTRYLHRLFETEGESVSSWIKQRRLERCRDDIIRSPLNQKSITDIAYENGFSDLSHFSKSFRSAFGTTARELLARSAADFQ